MNGTRERTRRAGCWSLVGAVMIVFGVCAAAIEIVTTDVADRERVASAILFALAGLVAFGLGLVGWLGKDRESYLDRSKDEG